MRQEKRQEAGLCIEDRLRAKGRKGGASVSHKVLTFLSSLGTGGRARRGAPTPASSPPPGLAGHARGTALAVAAAATMAVSAVVCSAEAVSLAVPVGSLVTTGEAEAVQIE